MSEKKPSSPIAGLDLTTTTEPNPSIPHWLTEALLLSQYWKESGLLKRLQHQVQVKRGRAGRYEVTDFVLLLLAYAVSEELTLADFFKALKPVEAVLMSAWERQKCPVASTPSSFSERRR